MTNICALYYFRADDFTILSTLIDTNIMDSPFDYKAFIEYNSYNEFVERSHPIQLR